MCGFAKVSENKKTPSLKAKTLRDEVLNTIIVLRGTTLIAT